MAVASTGYTLIGAEASFGAAPTRDTSHYLFYPAEEVEVMPGKEFIDFREIRGSRQAMITLDGAFRPTANLKGALYPTGAVALFLGGAFGGATTANPASGVYQHTFVDAATLPSFTLERSDKQGSGATIVERISGCKVESVQIGCAFGEKANLTVNFQAGKKPVKLSETFLTYNNSSAFPKSMLPYDDSDQLVDPLIFRDASITWAIDGGSETTLATVKNINLEFKNTITRQETLNGSDESYKLFEGGLECTLSGSMVFENTDMYQKMIDGTPVSIRLTFENNNVITGSYAHGIEFYWPSLKVSRASIPFKAGEVIQSDVEFKVRFDTSLNKMVQIVLTDTKASYSYS